MDNQFVPSFANVSKYNPDGFCKQLEPFLNEVRANTYIYSMVARRMSRCAALLHRGGMSRSLTPEAIGLMSWHDAKDLHHKRCVDDYVWRDDVIAERVNPGVARTQRQYAFDHSRSKILEQYKNQRERGVPR